MTTQTDPHTYHSNEMHAWVTIPDREYCEHDLETGSCPIENPE